jgi:hypothetical protein
MMSGSESSVCSTGTRNSAGPFLGYLLHVFISQFVIGLQLLLAFIPPRSDVNEVSVCAGTSLAGLYVCKVFGVIRGMIQWHLSCK